MLKMSDDLISRKAAIDILGRTGANCAGVYGDLGGACAGAKRLIESLPPAELERTVKVKPRGSIDVWATCECGQAVHLGWTYCPFCGGRIERK